MGGAESKISRILLTISFSMIGSYNSELFWVLQQRYFVLKERIAVFWSQVYGDSSLNVLCLPVRAGPAARHSRWLDSVLPVPR